MNKNRNIIYRKQLFDPEAGTIVTTDLDPAISIDLTARLNAGIDTLRNLLGITELTPMTAGTTIYLYKTTRKGDKPAQVAEGETIGLTEYQRKLVKTITLKLNKFRKKTTAEAIQRAGRGRAISETDEKLIFDVQSDIKAGFYTALDLGTGTTTPIGPGLQAGLAALWGDLGVYFQDVPATPVYFVNPLDIAAYLAGGMLTTQTAFGFKYIEDFLGLGTVIIDASVTKGTVKATVKENLRAAYVPAAGDVADSFGLTYDETGLVGMTHYIAGENASVETLMLSGVQFWAEDMAGIFTASLE